MAKFMAMSVDEALKKSSSPQLANEIWEYKHPGKKVDPKDKEYISWRNSLPHILKCAKEAGLGKLSVVFEMKTPISQKAIDVVLLGKTPEGKFKLLLVELKQWTRISTMYVNDTNKVYVPEAVDHRRHPLRQLEIYEKNLRLHHSGLLKSAEPVEIETLAYLHNFTYPASLYEGEYAKWSGDSIYGGGDDERNRLITKLKNTFLDSSEPELLAILEDFEAVLGDEGLEGLRRAYEAEASKKMKQDQQKIVNFVVERLNAQLAKPQPEIIVISGGAGTGKTIAGIRFILEYVQLFNGGKNDNKVIFSLPKSKTFKANVDAACGGDEERAEEYCCYLDDISKNQNLVVVDEAHRIAKLTETLDKVFTKGTKLLILLQDDHQILRPDEEGTFEKLKKYATSKGYVFSPNTHELRTELTLVDEKRCDERILKGVEKLFYGSKEAIEPPTEVVEVFDRIEDLEQWELKHAATSKTKCLLPFCWEWSSIGDGTQTDIVIGNFRKTWNPEDVDDQLIWLNDKTDHRAACIYTSQGLDMDNVAFVWWDDLRWDPQTKKWIGDPSKLFDPAFRLKNRRGRWTRWRKIQDGFERVYDLSQAEVDLLIKNTYYVMLTRPKQHLAIWFKDAATKQHVLEVLGLKAK